ncbi:MULTISPECIES: anti-repressor SinI family protein [Mesobacillus]|uniref:Antagonist of SinR n=1 Tax=Mesobacillus stamsii TaxID=225347 RepID=A0ABU0FZX1_9BACI|nr:MULTISPECIES: anti-repressor SinI family protein [Mesobacillus]MDQ0415255.1 antagonist of SinR [Mesobacillus stamsii]
MIKEQVIFEELDTEWIQLIMEALEMGINKEEIRKFIKNSEQK